MTLRASAPVSALVKPLTLSDGWLMSSSRDFPAPSVRARPSSRFQLLVVGRRLGERAPLGLAERLDVVVPALDGHAPRVVLHRGEQARERHRGVRRPVAVVAAVQRALRAVDGELDVRVAAHAEDDLLAPRLVDGAVADDPRVGREQLLVAREYLGEVRRAGLLLALEEELEVDGRLDALRAAARRRPSGWPTRPPCRPRPSARRAATRGRCSRRRRASAGGCRLARAAPCAARLPRLACPSTSRGSVGWPS